MERRSFNRINSNDELINVMHHASSMVGGVGTIIFPSNFIFAVRVEFNLSIFFGEVIDS